MFLQPKRQRDFLFQPVSEPLEQPLFYPETIMLKLELNDQEQEALADVLMSALAELRTEISHTDRQAFRQRLKVQEQLVRKVLDQLQTPA